MSDYRTLDKTEWFIQKMMSGWFSRTEIVDLAASEFPGTPRKTLDQSGERTRPSARKD